MSCAEVKTLSTTTMHAYVSHYPNHYLKFLSVCFMLQENYDAKRIPYGRNARALKVIGHFSILLHNRTSSTSPKALYSSVIKLEMYVTKKASRYITLHAWTLSGTVQGKVLIKAQLTPFGSFYSTQDLTYL